MRSSPPDRAQEHRILIAVVEGDDRKPDQAQDIPPRESPAPATEGFDLDSPLFDHHQRVPPLSFDIPEHAPGGNGYAPALEGGGQGPVQQGKPVPTEFSLHEESVVDGAGQSRITRIGRS